MTNEHSKAMMTYAGMLYKAYMKGCGGKAVSYTHLTLPTNREV